mgnify:CR=1 FL=1
MAYYNQVSTPRFYTNVLEWLLSAGYDINVPRGYRTLPVSIDDNALGAYDGGEIDNLPKNIFTEKSFLAILGHKAGGKEIGFMTEFTDAININADNGSDTQRVKPSFDGYSIRSFDGNDYNDSIDVDMTIPEPDLQAGSIIVGTYYEMSHSADLNVNLSYETSTKTIETKGGNTLSNTMHRPPLWGDLAAWTLHNPNDDTTHQLLKQSSRRIWDLSFSYIDKSDTFSKYNDINRYSNDVLSQDDLLHIEGETLLDSDDFFSQVWNRVGTSNAFIFQPDKDTNEYAICKFDMKLLQFKQVANSVYDIKLKIREVW